MKKLLAIVLSVLMLTSLVVFPTAAETDPLDGYMTVLGHQASVKPTGEDGNDKLYAIRIVAAHANLEEYSSFGYEVTVKYTDVDGNPVTKTLKTPVTSNCVYQELAVSGGGSIKASDYQNTDYISGVEITNIPASAGDLTIEVTPFVVFLNSRGTVKGSTQTLTHDLTVTTMTFNIHNHVVTDDHLERIKESIKSTMPDVIGFQEMSDDSKHKWVQKLMADTEIYNTYGYVGESRGDVTGEQTTIFYKKDKFTVVESGVRWLYCEHGIQCKSSDCIGATIAGCFDGSELKDSANKDIYFRILTYAKLKRISDKKEFVFINTHLDTENFKPSNPQYTYQKYERQNKQIEYVLNFAKTMTDAGYPVILTGDFNAKSSYQVVTNIKNAGFIQTQNTAYKTVGAEVEDGHKNDSYYYTNHQSIQVTPCVDIDHIFIYAEDCFVRTYTFCDEPIKTVLVNGVYEFPSDHIPRIAEYIIW